MTPDKLQNQRNLDARFAGGLAWTAGTKWATQILTWTSLLAVAHLLSGSDYGVGEMAGVLTNTSNVLAEFGIGTAVLHMPELSRKTLVQLNTFSCLLCAGIFALASLAAPWVAAFFHSDHLAIFVVNNSLLLFTGLQAVPMGLLARDMDYRRLSLLEAATVTVQSVCTILTAWLGWGYWALFAGNAAGRLTGTILVCFWKPAGFAWPRWNEIRRPAELGRQTAIGRIAGALYSQADGIVVGRLLGEAALGNYRIAMTLASSPAEKVSSLLMRTATPLFANIKDDLAQVRRYYRTLVELLSLLVIPMMVGLAIVAPLAVPLVFGSNWAPAVDPVRWLALFMIVRTLSTLSEQVLISQQLTRFTMRISIFSAVVMPVAFVIGAQQQGMGGVAAAWIFASPLTLIPLTLILLPTIQLPFRQYAATLLPSVVGSTAMGLALLVLRGWLPSASQSPKIALALQIMLGAAVYAAVVMGFFGETVRRYIHFFQDMRAHSQRPAPSPKTNTEQS